MADKKISQLTDNPNPDPDAASVPIIQSAVVDGNVVYTQYRSSVRNLVKTGVTGETLVDGGNF